MAVALHITGASGSGTTTLGRAVAARLGLTHLDTDDFYWAPVEPKFSVKRPIPQRLALLDTAIAVAAPAGWVLSGSLSGWGDPLIDLFTHVILMNAPTPLRLERLRARETAEFGAAAVGPGGARHAEFTAFIEWAAGYEDSGFSGRSRVRHETWLTHLPCPVLRLEGDRPLDALATETLTFLAS
jgi:adenylate kinase family enzyme